MRATERARCGSEVCAAVGSCVAAAGFTVDAASRSPTDFDVRAPGNVFAANYRDTGELVVSNT